MKNRFNYIREAAQTVHFGFLYEAARTHYAEKANKMYSAMLKEVDLKYFTTFSFVRFKLKMEGK